MRLNFDVDVDSWDVLMGLIALSVLVALVHGLKQPPAVRSVGGGLSSKTATIKPEQAKNDTEFCLYNEESLTDSEFGAASKSKRSVIVSYPSSQAGGSGGTLSGHNGGTGPAHADAGIVSRLCSLASGTFCQDGGTGEGTDMISRVLPHALDSTLAPERLVRMEYAVRGSVPIRAAAIQSDLLRNPGKYKFSKLIYCNIGNPLQVGLKPLTFIRQVLQSYWAPSVILRDGMESHPSDVTNLVSSITAHNKVGAYSHSRGMTSALSKCQEWLDARDGRKGSRTDLYFCNGASAGINSMFEILIDTSASERPHGGYLETFHDFGSGQSPGGSEGRTPARKDRSSEASDEDSQGEGNDGVAETLEQILDTNAGQVSAGVFIPIPQYPLYSATISKLGGSVIPYYLDEGNDWAIPSKEELDIAFLQSLRQGIHPKALVMINPGNPTGNLMSRDEIVRMLNFAKKRKLVVFADEVYQDNIWTDRPFISARKVMFEEGLNVKLASFHSTSKGFFGECGVRGGLMACDNFKSETIKLLDKLVSVSLCPNVSGQVVMTAVCSFPKPGDASYEVFSLERHSIKSEMKMKAETMAASFNAMQGVSCLPVRGAMYLFPKLELPQHVIEAAAEAGQIPDEYYCMKLVEATGIVCVPGSGFKQAPGTFHLRMTILPSVKEVGKAMKDIHAFHDKLLEMC